jgi:hypothetical protein
VERRNIDSKSGKPRQKLKVLFERPAEEKGKGRHSTTIALARAIDCSQILRETKQEIFSCRRFDLEHCIPESFEFRTVTLNLEKYLCISSLRLQDIHAMVFEGCDSVPSNRGAISMVQESAEIIH